MSGDTLAWAGLGATGLLALVGVGAYLVILVLAVWCKWK